MNLYDPLRKYVSHKPQLISFRENVVPFLMIFPNEEENKINISCMIPTGNKGKFESRRVEKTVDINDLNKILIAYREDPENTLETLFEFSLSISEPSDEDLARSIKRDHENKPKPIYNNISLEAKIASIEL